MYLTDDTWEAPIPYSPTILEFWDEPINALWRNGDPENTDFDDFMVPMSGIVNIPPRYVIDQVIFESGFSDYENSILLESAFYKISGDEHAGYGGWDVDERDMLTDAKMADARFLCYSFLACGNDYFDLHSSLDYTSASLETAVNEDLWDMTAKEYLTPHMLSTAMLADDFLSGVLHADNTTPLVATVGEVAFAVARFRRVFTALTGSPMNASRANFATALQELREVSGDEAFAWMASANMIKLGVSDEYLATFIGMMRDIRDVGLSFDEAVPLVLKGIYDADTIRSLVTSGVDIDLLASLLD